jgi:general stress protein YciG
MKETTMSDETKPKTRRGFACMTKEAQAAIASKGGKAAHAKGRAHIFTSDEAREAGRKGGYATFAKYGNGHLSRIGVAGGKKAHELYQKLNAADGHMQLELPEPSLDHEPSLDPMAGQARKPPISEFPVEAFVAEDDESHVA